MHPSTAEMYSALALSMTLSSVMDSSVMDRATAMFISKANIRRDEPQHVFVFVCAECDEVCLCVLQCVSLNRKCQPGDKRWRINSLPRDRIPLSLAAKYK